MKLELNKIYLMDALDGLRELDSECANIIIADPPYNIGKDFGVYKDRKDLREYVEWCKLWIGECIRILKPTGTMFIYGFSENLAYVFVEIPSELPAAESLWASRFHGQTRSPSTRSAGLLQ